MKIKNKHLLLIIFIISAVFVFAPGLALADNAGLDNFTKTKNYYSTTFRDVSSTAWYADNVETAYELGLVYGTSSNTYSPNSRFTIAEAITLASRMHSIYHTGSCNIAKGSPWYAGYVDYALENGIIDRTYSDYNKPITRAHMVTILINALPDSAYAPIINDISYGYIADVPTSAGYCADVYSFYRSGILAGCNTRGDFCPNTYIKRSEVAAILTRMVDPSMRVSFMTMQVLELLNDKRQAAGKSALVITAKHNQAASVRAVEIAGYFSHTRPNGTTYSTVLSQFNIPYNIPAECIGRNQKTAAQVVEDFFSSAAHREILLSNNYKKVGIAYYPYGSGYAWEVLLTN